MQVRAIDICKLLHGELEGNPDVIVTKPAKIEEGESGAISFFANPKYEKYLYSCQSSVLLIPKNFELKHPVPATLIRVEDVYASLSLLLEHFNAAQQAAQTQSEISAQAFVHESATVGENTSIAAFSYVAKNVKIGKNVVIYPQVWLDDDVVVGDNTVLYAGVKVYKGCKIGSDCIIHANVVIGKDGFGFAPQPDGSYNKIPQLGIVEIANKVEIGANTVIDRATMGRTYIAQGVKLDNLIQLAHNTSVGENTVIAAQTGVAGSTHIGKGCIIGGQVGFVGHITIADGTKVQAQSGVDKSIKTPNTAVYGSPALPYNDFLRSYIGFKNLPTLQKRVDTLEKKAQSNIKP